MSYTKVHKISFAPRNDIDSLIVIAVATSSSGYSLGAQCHRTTIPSTSSDPQHRPELRQPESNS
jgi:hypothetical protein